MVDVFFEYPVACISESYYRFSALKMGMMLDCRGNVSLGLETACSGCFVASGRARV